MKSTSILVLPLIGAGVEVAQALSVPFNNLLTRGQGYNTFLGKGMKHGAVQVTKNAKRGDEPVEEQPMTFDFEPPTADMSGVNVEEYFTAPDPDEIDKMLADAEAADKEQGKPKRGLVLRDAHADCAGKVDADTNLLTSYEKYLKALDISASATISGWGQSASMSGKYLDKSEFSSNSLIYVAKIEVKKQQNVDDKFKFNDKIYNSTTFDADFGDRWIRGFENGGKMIARLVITAKNKASTKDIQANTEASLKFWGVSADINASMKKSMDELSKQAEIKVSLFYQGSLGKVQEDQGSPSSISSSSAQDAFTQVKKWSDTFLKNACEHDYGYRALLDEYTTLENFPADQKVINYGVAEQISYIVLRELAKIAEMKQVLSESSELSETARQDVEFAYLDMVEACQKWTSATAKDPSQAKTQAKALLEKFGTKFYGKFKKDVAVGVKDGEKCGTQGGGSKCAEGLCCSSIGFCGKTDNHCGWFYGAYCQREFGSCYDATAEAGQKCGKKNGNKVCSAGLCCSEGENGVCSKKHVTPNNNYGKCPQ
ncbi:hypothetical protein BB8028_0005g06040 [Beauveria bassiana]|uniref:Chitin-binding type-1 domain-containing protein n=1 Tax=Beauveria bassiana TaxID=176275 RepID=A0A2S7YFY8_BEABA|nr:hypothetical protein BB8028_0005g06040 [Beauveria bassiana]